MAAFSIHKSIPKVVREEDYFAEAIGVSDDELRDINFPVDPYAGHSWSGDSLRRLIEWLQRQIDFLRVEIEKDVLRETK